MICTCRIRVSLKHLGIDTAPARECHGAIDHFLSNVLLNMLLTAVRIGQPLGSGIPRRGEEVATFKCKSKKNKALCFSCEQTLSLQKNVQRQGKDQDAVQYSGCNKL